MKYTWKRYRKLIERKYILKIYNSNHLVPEKVVLTEFPVTLGRSIKNTIVVDNESVSADHMRIEKDASENLVLTDLGSTNGIVYNDQRHDHLSLTSDSDIYLGEVRIHVHVEEENLGKTRTINVSELRKEDKTDYRGKVAAVTGFFLALSLFQDLLFQYFDKQRAVLFLVETISALMLLVLVTLLFAGISKLVNERFYFKKLFFYLLGFICVIKTAESFDIYLEFLFQSDTFDIVLGSIYGCVVLAFFFFYFCQVFQRYSRRSIATVYFSFVALTLFITAGKKLFLDEKSEANVNVQLVGAFTNPAQGVTPDKMFEKMDDAFEAVEKYREKVLAIDELADRVAKPATQNTDLR